MPVISQTDIFQKPAGYWLRRAGRWQKNGDLRRAAVLFRHAARLEPMSQEARLSYAGALRDLHCYEASNREAFAALAQDPGQFSAYGLIGRNMLSLGMRQEAMDCFALYMGGSHLQPDGLPDWDDEVYELEDAYYEPPVRRRARLRGLMDIALRRIAAGDFENARRALARAQQAPFRQPNARRDELNALYHERQDRTGAALLFIERALRCGAGNCQVAASAACMLGRMKKRRAACLALLRAAACAHFALDELMVCMTAEQLGLMEIARHMLARNLRREPGRVPTSYNLCVCLLKMGELEAASSYIHLCREIDPDDMPAELLFARMERWGAENAESETIAREIKEISFYGMLSGSEIYGAVLPLARALEQGVRAFSERLMTDGTFYRRCLYALSLPVDGMPRLLPALCRELPYGFAQRMLREALLCDPRDSEVKRVAAAELLALGAQPPFTIWHEGHIASVDPTAPLPAQPGLMQRLIVRRIARAKAIHGGGGIIPYALEMVRRMSPAQRAGLAGDPARVWPLALCMRYRADSGFTPLKIQIDGLNQPRAGELRRALKTLRTLNAIEEES